MTPRESSLLILSALLMFAPTSFANPTRGLASVGLSATACIFAKNMEVHGHRGMDGYPNNTIASFKAAYDVGVDASELDLQITKDNHILVAHDAIPNVGPERCGIDGKSIQKTALRDLDFVHEQQIRCGAEKFTDARLEPIPELAEVFSTFKDRKTPSGHSVKLNIEIKYFQDQVQYYPPMDQYLDMIVKVIHEGGWSPDRFYVQSFNQDVLKALKVKAPEFTVVPLIGDARNALQAADNVGTHLVTPGFWQVTPEIILQLHKKGIRAIVWTPNTEQEIRHVIESGADGIITDHPDLFYKIRDSICSL